jgi:hypothetical protein
VVAPSSLLLSAIAGGGRGGVEGHRFLEPTALVLSLARRYCGHRGSALALTPLRQRYAVPVALASGTVPHRGVRSSSIVSRVSWRGD